MFVFKFADIGEGLHEGKVVEIFVKPNDQVKEGAPLFSVETDKVTAEITAPVSGKIIEMKVAIDQIVHVGETIFVFDDGSGDATPVAAEQPAAPKEESKPTDAKPKGAAVVGEVQVSDEVIDFFSPKKPTQPKPSSTPSSTASQTLDKIVSQNPEAFPAAKKFAKENNVDLRYVTPSKNNRISVEDVQAYLAQKANQTTPASSSQQQVQATPIAKKMAKEHNIDLNQLAQKLNKSKISVEDIEMVLHSSKPSAPTPAPTPAPVPAAQPAAKPSVPTPTAEKQADDFAIGSGFVARREKPSGLRNAIAKNLKNSWNNVAYTNLVVPVNLTALWDLRLKIKDKVLQQTGIKLTFLPYIAKAAVIALNKFPIFTANYDDNTQELVFSDSLNLGIAVDTEKGLFVPNIKNAQDLSVLQIAKEIGRLAKLARSGQLKGADMANGHFTITNYGSAGAVWGTPVIKYPEIAILGTGTIVEQASSQGIQKIMYLTLAADHRWVDGATIGHFLTFMKQLLEDPGILGAY